MATNPSITIVVSTLAILVGATSGHAGPTDAQKCMSAKLKALSKYDLCVLKVEAKAALASQTGDTSLCDSKFQEKWVKPDGKYGLDCPGASDTTVAAEVHDHLDDIRSLLGIIAGTCGDGVIDTGEDCDGGLNGLTCASLGFSGGTLLCGIDCTYDTAACTSGCSLKLQDCESGEGCYFDGANGVCAIAGLGGNGAACTQQQDCAVGYGCVTDEFANSTCRQICDTGGGAPTCISGFCTGASGLPSDTGVCI